MKKLYYLVIILLIGGALIFILFSSCKTTNKVLIDKEMSYFSDFEVKNDTVFFKYHITLKNTFDTEKTVRLSTKLSDDVTTGLLKNAVIKALNEDGTEIEYTLPSNTTKSFDVVFIGEYAGTNKKYDRNLSEINIDVMK